MTGRNPYRYTMMRILVGVLGALLSLPWVIAFGVFHEAYSKPSDRLRAGILGLVFGACLVAAVGSLITPAWRRAGLAALAVVGALYAVPTVGHVVGRRRAAARRQEAARAPQAPQAPPPADRRAPGPRQP